MISSNAKKLIETWYKARRLALSCPRSLFVSVSFFACRLAFLSACISCNFKRLRSSSDASRETMWWRALCSPLGVGTSSCLPVTFFLFGVNTSRVVTVDVLLGVFSHWAGQNVVDLALCLQHSTVSNNKIQESFIYCRVLFTKTESWIVLSAFQSLLLLLACLLPALV